MRAQSRTRRCRSVFRFVAARQIGIAALLHDVGKLFVPEEILTSPAGHGRESEWKLMREHPVPGARYLLDNREFRDLLFVTALSII